ncbi:MAG: hypothetical protein LBS63_02905 [Prevotellaceae bacterium]|nr:hypothetical protein [Prevotellaceae bacterium]
MKFDSKTGGLMATHINHNFDPEKGWYEETVQKIAYENGNAVILEKENTGEYLKRHTEGTWNRKSFEISGKETATANNIKNGLNHCAGKPGTEIAALFFPNNNFDIQNFERGFSMYSGLEKIGAKGYRKFEQIICIDASGILYKKSHQ